MPKPPASFKDLLGQTAHFFEHYTKPMLLGMVCFAFLLTSLQVYLSWRMKEHMADSLMRMDVNELRVEELGERLRAGDEAALDEMMQEIIAASERLDAMTEEEREVFIRGQAMESFDAFLPVTLTVTLLGIVLFFCSAAFYTLQAIIRESGHTPLARAYVRQVFPLCGFFLVLSCLYALPEVAHWLMPWAFGFPLLGLLLFCLMAPRLLLVPVLVIEQQRSWWRSLGLSYRQTKGSWVRIVGFSLLMWLAILLVLFVAGFATHLLAMISTVVQLLVQSLLVQFLLAAMMVFWVELARDTLRVNA